MSEKNRDNKNRWRNVTISVECQPVIDGDVCFGNIEQERGTHLYHTKQGELL